MTNVAVSDVVLTTLTEALVTPVPLMVKVVAPEMKFIPVRVTGTLVP